MIVNEPNFDGLNFSALRFHYSAWEILLAIIQNFEDTTSDDPRSGAKGWQEYIEKANYDYQAIYTFLAQANELALRAKICSISPYLLLINTENKFKNNNGNVDFTELRTVDAVDLPNLVNALSDDNLSSEFAGSYHRVRSIRNKIMHLGAASADYRLPTLISLLVDQYSELWGAKGWFKNWIEYSTKKRSAHFFDYKYFTEYTDVMFSLPTLREYLSKSQFNAIFGFSKSKRQYICYDCCSAACIERNGLHLADYPSAFLKDRNTLYCAVCEKDYAVSREECLESDCSGDVIFSDDSYTPICCTCGCAQG